MSTGGELDFSIVTPSYNYGHYIGECLESVACQEGVTLEHLVMDAGSTDDTAEVVKGFEHALFYQEPDKGMSDGINKGFRRAKGKWVMWLNSDDRLKPGVLAKVKRFVESREKADVVYGGWDFIDADGVVGRRMTVFPFDLRMMIYTGCYVGSTACFFRRETVLDEGYLLNEHFGYCMDTEYYVRLGAEGKRFEYYPEVIADFRLHEESISQREIGARGIDGLLRRERQHAEHRAVVKLYGSPVFDDALLDGLSFGIQHHFYRMIRGFQRWRYRGMTK
ncbi:MAG: glycosyltransferase family 2 protein [Verrucomicrobiaceae bacterium]